MELSQHSLEASCKLAFELGQAKALEDWDRFHEKEASMTLGKGLMGGVKSFLGGTGFRSGVRDSLKQTYETTSKGLTDAVSQARSHLGGLDKADKGYAAAQQALKDAQGNLSRFTANAGNTAPTTLGQAFMQPIKNTYQTFRANRYAGNVLSNQKAVQQAQANVRKLKAPGSTATPEQVQQAEQALAAAQGARSSAIQSFSNYGGNSAKDLMVMSRAGYQSLPTALGYAAIPAGAAYLGYQALPGGNTVNITRVQPQAAPHQYYLNQLSNMFS